MTEYGSGPCIRIIPREGRAEIYTYTQQQITPQPKAERKVGKRREGARALDRQVLALLQQGKSQSEIAAALGLSVPGVAYRLSRMREIREQENRNAVE